MQVHEVDSFLGTHYLPMSLKSRNVYLIGRGSERFAFTAEQRQNPRVNGAIYLTSVEGEGVEFGKLPSLKPPAGRQVLGRTEIELVDGFFPNQTLARSRSSLLRNRQGRHLIVEYLRSVPSVDQNGGLLWPDSAPEAAIRVRYAEPKPHTNVQEGVFDLYGSADSLKVKAREARADLSELFAAQPDDLIEQLQGYGGLGHNQPPPEFLTTADKRREIIESLNVIERLNDADQSNRELALAAARVVWEAGRALVEYLTPKLDKFFNSFVEEAGKAAASTIKWTLVATSVGGTLMTIAAAVKGILIGG